MAKNGEYFYGEFAFLKPPLSPFFAIDTPQFIKAYILRLIIHSSYYTRKPKISGWRDEVILLAS